jgi:hypothetical protein
MYRSQSPQKSLAHLTHLHGFVSLHANTGHLEVDRGGIGWTDRYRPVGLTPSACEATPRLIPMSSNCCRSAIMHQTTPGRRVIIYACEPER